jgi:DNA-directed RNA polymerase beta' subunit
MAGNSKAGLCGTCNKRIDECVGHFGHISLALPVFHAGFLRPLGLELFSGKMLVMSDLSFRDEDLT